MQAVRAGVASNTVDRLKGIITSLNGALGSNIPKSGRKADHIQAIQVQLDILRANNQSARWLIARRIVRGEVCVYFTREAVCCLHLTRGVYSYSSGTSLPGTSYSSTTSSPYTPSAASAYSDISSSTSVSRPYRPIGAPVPPPPRLSEQTGRLLVQRSVNDHIPILLLAIRFNPSPFHVVERALADVVSPSEVRNNSERSTATMHFSITAEQRSALSANTHQVRFYCTSGQFYSPAFPTAQTIVPMEFPPVVDIRVNGTAVQGANTRGLKKKPGTAPPVDISKLCRAGANRIDFTYMNNSSPFSPKVSCIRTSAVWMEH